MFMLKEKKIVKDYWDAISVADDENKRRQTSPPNVEKKVNIPYIKDGKTEHMLDIYYSTDTNREKPVFFDIHGGGWAYGSKELNDNFCMSFAEKGFTVVNINYGLVPKYRLWDMVRDIFAAMRWLSENGKDYFCDTANVFIVGDSAGGHLASLVTAINANERLCGFYGVKSVPLGIRGEFLISPVVDMSKFDNKENSIDVAMGKLFFGTEPEKSPFITKCSIKDLIDESPVPPLCVVSFEADTIHHKPALDFCGMLEERKLPYKLILREGEAAKNMNHVFNVLYWDYPEGEAINAEAAEYLKSLVK